SVEKIYYLELFNEYCKWKDSISYLFYIMFKLKHISIYFFLLTAISINCQTSTNDKALYKWFDTNVGLENIGLLNGTAYTEKYRTSNGNHEFYSSSSFQTGDIVYNGQPYFDIAMKYDIHNDEIIVEVPTQTNSFSIQLIKEKVYSFSINGSNFISIRDLTNENSFYEVIIESSKLAVYKKNIKTSNKYYSGRSMLYSFKSKDEYLLYFKNEYHKITKSKKSLIKLLPEYKKEISSLYKTQSELLNINYDLFIQKLVKELTNTLSKL
ncbi:hypothetical protein, partial [uncultured Wocania sp.]|uniref:hypothetical protein n=1 Tax=uncultured Wocania sp. TaxID=2834404 RepID=UPI0030FAF222